MHAPVDDPHDSIKMPLSDNDKIVCVEMSDVFKASPVREMKIMVSMRKRR